MYVGMIDWLIAFSLGVGERGVGDTYNKLIFSIVGIFLKKGLLSAAHLIFNLGVSNHMERQLQVKSGPSPQICWHPYP